MLCVYMGLHIPRRRLVPRTKILQTALIQDSLGKWFGGIFTGMLVPLRSTAVYGFYEATLV